MMLRLHISALIACILVQTSSNAEQVEYDQSITNFLRVNFDQKDVGMVVAIIDHDGVRTFQAGKTGNETNREVNADTVFEIGSCTKTFTALLLQEMAHRGEMNVSDPITKCLPASVHVPSRNGKEITLLNLAAQDSGLPFNATNHTGADWGERFATYTVPMMYDFLSSHELEQVPGVAFQYSNIGMGILGHVISLKAGASYESLVVDRICTPLQMDSTRITLTPDLKSRMAQGHDEDWKPTPNYELPAMPGAGALHSTANDLVKYVSANLGLMSSPLTPLMQEMQVLRHRSTAIDFGDSAMPWYDSAVYNQPGSELLGHGGGTGGFSSFIGFDKLQRRGIVILSNQVRVHSSILGWRILQHAKLDRVDPVTMTPIRQVSGIGLQLAIDKKSHKLVITGARPNTPAERAGLTAGTVQAVEGDNNQRQKH